MEIESNPCIRCGKERLKTKEGTVIMSSVKTKITVYVCPDKDCQKKVEKKIAEKEERRLFLLNRSRQRALNRSAPKKAAKPVS